MNTFDYIFYGVTLCSNILVWTIYDRFKKEKNEAIKIKEDALNAQIEYLKEKAALIDPNVFKEYKSMEIQNLKDKLAAKEITLKEYEQSMEIAVENFRNVYEAINSMTKVINEIHIPGNTFLIAG